MVSANPKVFLSHSTADADALARLKELFVEKTGGSIEVFLSSDGASIPLGVNWVHALQEALESTGVMFVFVSPASLRSSWLYFEAGFSYSKKIKVVPVGFLGVDLGTLPPPLSLLQGFNLTDADRLNNVLSVVNETFGHSHRNLFTGKEFAEIAARGSAPQATLLGKHGFLVHEITTSFSQRDMNLSNENALDKLQDILRSNGIEHDRGEGRVRLPGAVAEDRGKAIAPSQIDVAMEPSQTNTLLPIVATLASNIRKTGIAGWTFTLKFDPQVEALRAPHQVSGRLHGSGARLATGNGYLFGNLHFEVGHFARIGAEVRIRSGDAYVMVSLRSEEDLTDLAQLLDLLFERRVLSIVA